MFSFFKGKAVAIGGAIIGIMAIVISVLRASLSNEKRERAEQELEDEKVAREHSNKATEALIKGVEHESDDTDSSKHKFGE